MPYCVPKVTRWALTPGIARKLPNSCGASAEAGPFRNSTLRASCRQDSSCVLVLGALTGAGVSKGCAGSEGSGRVVRCEDSAELMSSTAARRILRRIERPLVTGKAGKKSDMGDSTIFTSELNRIRAPRHLCRGRLVQPTYLQVVVGPSHARSSF